jgi:hypothetical protein
VVCVGGTVIKVHVFNYMERWSEGFGEPVLYRRCFRTRCSSSSVERSGLRFC